MGKKIIFTKKKEMAKITIRVDPELKVQLMKTISLLKKEYPDQKVNVNELIRNYIVDFIANF
jgi:hypothetical protein